MLSRSQHEDVGVALGFFAPPYPPFRLPGWQRGSVGVHSDDGRRYVGNDEGGVDFTEPFKVGETVGFGMTIEQQGVEVFFTRDGRKVGGWNLLHDTDAVAEAVDGLKGDRDLFAGVGFFGGCEVDVCFGESGWMYRGWNAVG